MKLILILFLSIIGLAQCRSMKEQKLIQYNQSPFEKSYQIDDIYLLALFMCSSYENFQNIKQGNNYGPDLTQYQTCVLFQEYDHRIQDIIAPKQTTYFLGELQTMSLSLIKKFMDEQQFHGLVVDSGEIPHYADFVAQGCQEYLEDPLTNKCTNKFQQFINPWQCHMKTPDVFQDIDFICKSHSYRLNNNTIFHQLTSLTSEELDQQGNRWDAIYSINRLKQAQKQGKLLLGDDISDYKGIIKSPDGFCDAMTWFCGFPAFTAYAEQKCRTAAIACKTQYYTYDDKKINANQQSSVIHLGGVLEGKLQSGNQNILGECLIINDICGDQLDPKKQCSWFGCHACARAYECNNKCSYGSAWIEGFKSNCSAYTGNDGKCSKYKEHMLSGVDPQQKKEMNETTLVNAII